MPVTIEVRVLPVSGENRFADGSPLTPPSRAASGGEGLASRLRLVRLAEALWDKDNQDEA